MDTYQIVVLILLSIIFFYWETIRFNFTAMMILNRGVIAPNKFWFSISDALLTDSNGVQLFNNSKKNTEILCHNCCLANLFF